MDHPTPTPRTAFPAGRTFKEWATLSHRDQDTWRDLLAEARGYAREQAS